ncbi:hypothetical protein M569_14012, partial [Genlisea aurea]
LFIAFVILRKWKSSGKFATAVPTNWPVVGMWPAALRNCHRVHDFITEVLSECGGTFEFKGPWLCNMDMLFTCDPANIHHVFSRNFANYPKGPEFMKIFDVLGNGIFNADFELWKFHRKTTMGFMGSLEFSGLIEGIVWRKVEKGLFPVLDLFAETGDSVDLQDVFQRFTFDGICKVVLDFDPESLSVGFPEIQCEKAFNDVIDALLYRHVLPEFLWKAMKNLGIGKEKRLTAAKEVFDSFIYPKLGGGDRDCTMLRTFTAAVDENDAVLGPLEGSSAKFLRDTALSLMFAGRDTTSTCLTWLFWLLTQNPSAEGKILGEIEEKLNLRPGDRWRGFTVEESRRLSYLHGALSESLRLFPPVALEHKAPADGDTLPTGNRIEKNTKIIFSFYSMGRMESIWGKDCLKFKPERWISDVTGGVVHAPSYYFPAFNVGPRTCLGKDMAFIQMKMVAAAIVFHYQVEIVDGAVALPRDSIILQTKNGLRVRLSKR